MNDEVRVRCIHGGVGAITESDVMLATASNAIIVGFNVRPDAKARENAERDKVDVRLYRVIYNAIEDVEKAMKGMLAPQFKKSSSAGARSGTSSRSAGWAPSPAATSRKAKSPAQPRSASCGTASSSPRTRFPLCAVSRTT